MPRRVHWGSEVHNHQRVSTISLEEVLRSNDSDDESTRSHCGSPTSHLSSDLQQAAKQQHRQSTTFFIDNAIRWHLSVRQAQGFGLSCAWFLLVSLMMHDPFYRGVKRDKAAILVAVVAVATPVVAVVAFCPSDALLQVGWGRRVGAIVCTIGLLIAGAEFREVWRGVSATELVPAHPYSLTHMTTTTLWLASYATLATFASTGRITWGLIRFHCAFEPGIVAASVLFEAAVLMLGVDGARCVTLACRSSETLLETCAKQCFYTLGLWSISFLLSESNRRSVGCRMGLTHVRLTLSDVRGQDLACVIPVDVGSALRRVARGRLGRRHVQSDRRRE